MVDISYYPFESGFETGDFTEWSGGKTDTDSKFAVRHYVEMAEKFGNYPDAIPFRGGYLAALDLSGGTADAYAQDTAIAIPGVAGGTVWIRFYFQVTSDLVMAGSDRLTILTLQSAGPVDEVTISLYSNSGQYQLVVGARAADVTLDAWHCLELGCVVDSGGSDGTITFYLDGWQIGASITGLTQAALTQLRVGAIDIDVGTTAGHLFFDEVVMDTSRIFPHQQRWPQVFTITKSGLLIPGYGRIWEMTLASGGAVDNFLRVYDRNTAPPQSNMVSGIIGPPVANTNPYEFKTFAFAHSEGYFSRGLWVELLGTAPRATVTLAWAYTSPSMIREHALLDARRVLPF